MDNTNAPSPSGIPPAAETDAPLKQNKTSAFRNSIVAGLFVVIPIGITIWIAWWTIQLTTNWSVSLIGGYLKFPGSEIAIRVATIILLVLLVFFVGLLARITFGKKLIKFAQKIMMRIPLLSIVYSTCEQIGETVKSSRGGLFKKVALFEYPKAGCWAIGFITNCNEKDFELAEHLKDGFYSIFMPTTPNPTSGFLLFIPKKDCIILEMTVGEAMRLIVSGGAIIPGDPDPKKEE